MDDYNYSSALSNHQETCSQFLGDEAKKLEYGDRCFFDTTEDNLEHLDINNNYSDQADEPCNDVALASTAAHKSPVELKIFEMVKRADSVCAQWDCLDFRILVGDQRYSSEEQFSNRQSLLNLRKVESDLYAEDGEKKFRMLQTALLRSLIDYKVSDVKEYVLLLKTFYVQLYDYENNCSVASFELLKKDPQWANGRAKRQPWREDAVKNLLFDDETCYDNTTFERGHFVSHGNWNYSKEMVSEMSVLTNAFPQIKGFVACMDVEQFGKKLSHYADVFIITCPIERCQKVVKIFRWTTRNSTMMLLFSFPNTKREFCSLSSEGRRFGGSFITNRSILGQLPFKIENPGNVTFIHEEPKPHGKWKQQIIKLIRLDF